MAARTGSETATYHYGFSRRQIDTWRHTTNPYTLVIRSPFDPERQTPGMQGAYGVDPHNALGRIERGELALEAFKADPDAVAVSSRVDEQRLFFTINDPRCVRIFVSFVDRSFTDDP